MISDESGVAGDLDECAVLSVAAGEPLVTLRNVASGGQPDTAFLSLPAEVRLALGVVIGTHTAAWHRWRMTVIERAVAHTPKIGTRVGPCPVCGVGTLRISRDGPHYNATCESGCGVASVVT